MTGSRVTEVVAVTGRHRWGTVTTHRMPGEPDQIRARSNDGSSVTVALSGDALGYAAHYEAARYLVWGEFRHGEVRRIAGPYWHPDYGGDVYNWVRQ